MEEVVLDFENSVPERSMLLDAVELHDKGFCVLPSDPDSKHPILKWKKYKTERPTREEMVDWFRSGARPPGIGMVTGTVSGCTDVESDSPVSTEMLLEKFIPDFCPSFITPTNGHRHFLFDYEPGLSTYSNPETHIDVRNDGGFTMLPPSERKEGSYKWVVPIDGPLPKMPTELIDFLKKNSPKKSVNAGSIISRAEDTGFSTSDQLNLAKYLTHYGVPFAVKQEQGRTIYQLEKCPFSEGHTSGDGLGHSALIQGSGGLITLSCLHAHCRDKKWADARFVISGTDSMVNFFSDPIRKGDGPTIWAEDPTPSLISGGKERTFIVEEERRILDFPQTDSGNAEALHFVYKNQFVFARENGEWRRFNGIRWIEAPGQFRLSFIKLMRFKARLALKYFAPNSEEMKDLLRWCTGSESVYRLSSGMKLAEDHFTTDKPFDHDQSLLGVENGVVELKAGIFRQARPEDLLYRSTHITYDPAATCPRWIRFLDEIFSGDEDIISWIKRAIGYSLTGSTREQCLFIMFGGGENGKSTFAGILSRLLGDYAISAASSTFKVKKLQDGIPNDIARMRGARIVTSIEIGEGAQLDEERIKNLTGEDIVHGRFLYQEGFDFVPECKFWIAANHKPTIKGTDWAIWRRLRLIPFNVKFPREIRDNLLGEKLRSELPGILNWAVEGCLEWQTDGLGTPDVISTATEAYREEQDVVSRFICERCEIDASESVLSEELFTDYTEWCNGSGEKPLSRYGFGLKLREHGFESKKSSGGPNRMKWTWLGIGLPVRMA